MGRTPCCSKEGLNKGAWTALEDKVLVSYIKTHGEGKWRSLPKRAGLKRCGKSCRLRWLNYLRPDIKRGNISDDEEELIIRLHNLLGNRWSLIAGRLPGRTDNEIKNYWNTTLGKKARRRSPQFLMRSNSTSKSEGKRPISAAPQQNDSPPLPPPTVDSTSPVAPAIRTKASRCSRVFIPAGHLSPQGATPPDLKSDSQMIISSPVVTAAGTAGVSINPMDGAICDSSFFDAGKSGIDGEQGMPMPSGSDFWIDQAYLDDWLASDCFQPNHVEASPSSASAVFLDLEEWLCPSSADIDR